MIQIKRLTKRFGATTAVDQLSCTVHPGRVTGFLGPNGAGKSTTLRTVAGLLQPTSGKVLVDGLPYRDSPAPMRTLGALLDASEVVDGRTAYAHLLGLAATAGIGRDRVHTVLGMTGLEAVAGRRIKGFSLGMRQRLGIAAALLGDPANLLLDEPVNGLDPEGVRWVRQLLRGLAAEGRTVLLSSHLMSEMQQTADHLVVIGRGRVLADAPIAQLLGRQGGGAAVLVRTPDADLLAPLLRATPGVVLTELGPGRLQVQGMASEQVGELAGASGAVLHELSPAAAAPAAASLEDAYFTLTHDHVDYRSEAA